MSEIRGIIYRPELNNLQARTKSDSDFPYIPILKGLKYKIIHLASGHLWNQRHNIYNLLSDEKLLKILLEQFTDQMKKKS